MNLSIRGMSGVTLRLYKASNDIVLLLPDRQAVEQYLAYWGANQYESQTLMRICWEESKCQKIATNPSNGISGTFQYAYTTFINNCEGYYLSAFDQTKCALKDLRAGRLSQWQVTIYW